MKKIIFLLLIFYLSCSTYIKVDKQNCIDNCIYRFLNHLEDSSNCDLEIIINYCDKEYDCYKYRNNSYWYYEIEEELRK